MFLAAAVLAFHEGTAENTNDLRAERTEKLEVLTESGIAMRAALVGKGVEIKVSHGASVLSVPLAETTGLEISLVACEIRASEAKNAGKPPAAIEVIFGYGKPSDPFKQGKNMTGTVVFRFLDGEYAERTRVDLETKTAEEYRKPAGKPEVMVSDGSRKAAPASNDP